MDSLPTLAFCIVAAACSRILYLRAKSRKQETDTPNTLRMLLEDIGTHHGHWRYKAEGGANVAYGYVGPCRILRGHLLRLRKIRKEERTSTAESDELLPHTPLVYAHTVMKPLIGEQYVVPGIEVPVTREYLEGWCARLVDETARPESRRQQHLDVEFGKVVLMVDHTALVEPWEHIESSDDGEVEHDICVELKPKSGVVWPGAPTEACRFCMHQIQKYMEDVETARKPDRISRYCPMALFSRKPAAVAQILRALCATPQNNFRLFVDGSLKSLKPSSNYTESGCGSHCTLPTVCRALQGCWPWLDAAEHCHAEVLMKTLSSILLQDPVLNTIKTSQALDTVGVEKTWDIYRSACAVVAPSSAALPDDSAELPGFAARVEAHLAGLPPSAEERKIFQNFFIATTAKDCSLMLTFRLRKKALTLTPADVDATASKYGMTPGHIGDEHLRRNRNSFVLQDNCIVSYSVAVVDLDPKPIARMPHYIALDREILSAFRKYGASIFASVKKSCYLSAADTE